ncbi:MAG: LPS assembly lipoprotein LptE [Rubricoccaceae bacterium]
MWNKFGAGTRAAALALGLALLAGCGVYSFTGATLPAGLNTVAVPLAEDRTTGGPPDLDRQLTDALVSRFADRTRLRLVADEAAADAIVRASLDRYGVSPVAVAGDDLASLNRVALTVTVVFEDQLEGTERLRRTFSATADYPPAEGLAGEAAAVQRAIEQIAADAFTAATSDW